MTTLVELSQIAPPPGSVAEQSLPLTFIDIIWLTFHPVRRLLFYELPCSKPHFLEKLVPKLKQSLSLTLKHLFPLAGNIIYPLNPDELPVIRYIPGDSISLTICESSDDFDTFVANHARDADKFYNLVPQLPPLIEEHNHKLLKVLALQLTLFPGRGICIGVANHHSVGDGTSIAAFLRLWASINKLGGDEEILNFPILDRSVFLYPKNLDSIFWKSNRNNPFSSLSYPTPTERVRATYFLSQSQLEKLKHSIQTAVPDLGHVSSFVATAAYVWSCLAESEEEGVEDDRVEYFLTAIDLRARLDPPVPENYFGNCLSYGLTKLSFRELVRDGGLFAAAEAVAKAIRERVSDKKKILEDMENWTADIDLAMQGSILSVSGSAKADIYGVDFGWGRVRKLEMLSIDQDKYAMALAKSGGLEGGLEIGMSLPKLRMDAFAASFARGFKNL